MKVVLLEDVDKVGKGGATVRVASGFARNYLLPRKLALPVTPESLRYYEQIRRSLQKKAAGQKKSMEQVAAAIDGTELTAKVMVGEEGKLFGSVTATEVSRLLKEAKNLEIDKRKIGLDEPIKALGDYQIPIRLFTDVVAHIKLSIIPQET